MVPLCFVLMPFGRKPTAAGSVINFDRVYDDLIRPAIAEAGLEPLRADEELTGGVIHKAMIERLVLCPYAVADLTTANPNVFYELGLRHAAREASTVLMFAQSSGQLPFDVSLLRGLPYAIDGAGLPGRLAADREALVARLREAQMLSTDSPVYEFLEGVRPPDIAHMKTDVFRERVRYAEDVKAKLRTARSSGLEAVRAAGRTLEPIAMAEAAVVLDLLLSFRAVQGWNDMIELVERMSPPMRAAPTIQEQLGLALNRAGRDEEAERVLTEVVTTQGPSAETFGLLGRVFKDRWDAARLAGNAPLAQGMLARAIDTYLKGFEADWRDAYPGVNAVTLMELSDPPDPRAAALAPVVAYAVERMIATGTPDYWDYATRLELAVLARDEARARAALALALATVRRSETWETATTVRNLGLIRAARTARGESLPWAEELERALAGPVTP